MLDQHRVRTPENVDFTHEIAGLGSRMLAVAIDHVAVLLLLGVAAIAGVILAIVLGFFTAGFGLLLFGGPLLALVLLAFFLIYFGYFVFFEWRRGGQTPGKRLMNLRVIDERGLNIGPFQAVVRNLVRIVDVFPLMLAMNYVSLGFYGVGGTVALCSPRWKRLGDWAAGTVVVRTRRRVLPEAVLPPQERYNSIQEDPVLRARIRGSLTREEQETLLQLCLRREELEYDARHELFREAAAFLEERLSLRREPFLSEEKLVRNVVAVTLAENAWARRA
jgi:uncharacterized RDD family membrane protein YckC